MRPETKQLMAFGAAFGLTLGVLLGLGGAQVVLYAGITAILAELSDRLAEWWLR